MANILVKELGEASAIDSAAIQAIDGRVTTNETDISALQSRASDIESSLQNVAAGEDILNKIMIATGFRFGLFQPGYYHITSQGVDTQITESDKYVCATVECTENDAVRITCKVNTNDTMAWCCVKSDGTLAGNASALASYTNHTVNNQHRGMVRVYVNALKVNPQGSQNAGKPYGYYVAVGGNTKSDISSLASKVNSLVLAQDTQPNDANNKIWFDTSSGNQVTFYTKDEVDTLLDTIVPGSNPDVTGYSFTQAYKDKLDSLNTTGSVSENDSTHIPTAKAVYDHVASVTQAAVNAQDLGDAAVMDTLSSFNEYSAIDAKLPTDAAVKTYVDNTVSGAVAGIIGNNALGTAAFKDSASSVTANGGNLPTQEAVATYVNGQIAASETGVKAWVDENYPTGSAASKDIVTSLTGTMDNAHLPTAKAVKDYIGTAGTLPYETQVSSGSGASSVPTTSAVYDFVTSGDSAVLQSAKDYSDDNLNLATIGLSSDIEYLADALSSLNSSTAMYQNRQLDLVIGSGVTGDMNVPTAGAVKSYVGGVKDDIDDAIETVESSVSDVASDLADVSEQVDVIQKRLNSINQYAEPVNGRISTGTFNGVDPHGNPIVFTIYPWDTQHGMHVCLIVNPGDSVAITPNALKGSTYAFLTEYNIKPETPVIGMSGTPTHITDETSFTIPDASQTGGHPVQYLYIEMYDETGTNVQPESVSINDATSLIGKANAADVDSVKRMMLSSGGSHGTLGEDDWTLNLTDDYGIVISRSGSSVTIYGTYTGGSTLYVKITGSLKYMIGGGNQGALFDPNDKWAERIAGNVLQLQVSRNRDEDQMNKLAPAFSAKNFSNPTEISGSVYYTIVENASRPQGTTFANDTGLAYNGSLICSNGETDENYALMKPNCIIMTVPSNCTSFGNESNPIVYDVWLEDMSSEKMFAEWQSVVSQSLSSLNQMVSVAVQPASYYNAGLMSAADKTKLNAFGPASMYVTKYELMASYTLRGTVATVGDLPSDEDSQLGDMYYVTAEESMYVFYNGFGWWKGAPNAVVIDTISNNTIDLMFP